MSVGTPLMPFTSVTSESRSTVEIEELLEEMIQLAEALLIERATQETLIVSLQKLNDDLLQQVQDRDEENQTLKSMYEPLRTELDQWSERFPVKLREYSVMLFERQQPARERESVELLTIFEAELRGVVKNLLNDLARVATTRE